MSNDVPVYMHNFSGFKALHSLLDRAKNCYDCCGLNCNLTLAVAVKSKSVLLSISLHVLDIQRNQNHVSHYPLGIPGMLSGPGVLAKSVFFTLATDRHKGWSYKGVFCGQVVFSSSKRTK